MVNSAVNLSMVTCGALGAKPDDEVPNDSERRGPASTTESEFVSFPAMGERNSRLCNENSLDRSEEQFVWPAAIKQQSHGANKSRRSRMIQPFFHGCIWPPVGRRVIERLPLDYMFG